MPSANYPIKYLHPISADIKVSVVLITYNHENYIQQAVESILSQQVTFAYEIVICEDASSDRTREIVQDYQRRYPDKIHLLLAERNRNSNLFFVEALETCRGGYIALLEGDDYWCCADKLQKQVDFMDAHPQCSISFHEVQIEYEAGDRPSRPSQCGYPEEVLPFEYLLRDNFGYTGSTLFRRECLLTVPEWYVRDLVKVGDYPLFIFCAQHHQVGYLHQVLGAYRVHAGGLWSSKSEVAQIQNAIATDRYLCRYLQQKSHRRILQAKMSYLHYQIGLKHRDRKERLSAILSFCRSFVQRPFNRRVPVKTLFAAFRETLLPSLA